MRDNNRGIAKPMYLESSESRSERQAAYSAFWKIFVKSRGFANSAHDSICMVAGETAIGLTTQLIVFRAVDFLEDRALVPGGSLELLQRLGEFLLGDVQDLDLQHLIRLGVVDEIVQATPGAFQGLELRMVNDEIDLLGEFAVD